MKYALPLTAKAVRAGAADYTSVVSKAVMVNTPPGNMIVAKIFQRAAAKLSDSLQQHPLASPHCGCCTCFVGSLARQTSSTTSRSLAWSTNFSLHVTEVDVERQASDDLLNSQLWDKIFSGIRSWIMGRGGYGHHPATPSAGSVSTGKPRPAHGHYAILTGLEGFLGLQVQICSWHKITTIWWTRPSPLHTNAFNAMQIF